jgi:hypothetical protein
LSRIGYQRFVDRRYVDRAGGLSPERYYQLRGRRVKSVPTFTRSGLPAIGARGLRRWDVEQAPAPGIIERILTGEEPKGISPAKLRTNLPVLWKEQAWV